MSKQTSGHPTRFILIRGDLPTDTEVDENPFPLGGGPEVVRSPEEQRHHRRSFPRTLRTYERMARQYHHCDECMMQIEPGDLYEGRIVVQQNRTRHRLYVHKKHVEPYCPRDPWEDVRFHAEQSERSDVTNDTRQIA